MSTRQDTARLLFGGIESATRRTMAMGTSSVRQGTAQADSSGGKVSVLMDGSTQAVDLRCATPVKKGQRGTVLYQGGTYVFVALEQLAKDSESNAKAIEEAQKTLSQAQSDLEELDTKLYGDGTAENPGAMKQLEDNLSELDAALDGLDKDLHGEGGLDEQLSGLSDDLSTLDTDLYGEDGKSGKLGENGELAKRMSGLDESLGTLNTDLYGDGTAENPGKLAELDANLDPDNEDGAMGQAVAKANAAQEAAKTAKETADGKNRVYAQSSQPSGTFVQGDLWRKLDGDGNIVGEYVWNGSAWAKHALTADSLLVGSIVSASAFVEALQANKLTASEVDAASIVTRSVISEAVKADKLDSNEINVKELAADEAFIKTLVAAKLFAEQIGATTIISDFLEANKVTANQISAGAVTTDKLGANAVTADKVSAASLAANEAWMKTLAASTALVESLYASLITAHNITADQLISADNTGYAKLAGAVLELFDGSSNSLTKLGAAYTSFCQGALYASVTGNKDTILGNSKGGALELSGNQLFANGSWGSPRGTATMAASGSMALTSSEAFIPFTQVRGSGMHLDGNGVSSPNISGNVVAGFAMFEGVSAGKNCALALYEGSTQIAQAISTSAGDHCTVSIGPIARPSASTKKYYLKARTGGGGGYIGNGSDADQKAALTVWT